MISVVIPAYNAEKTIAETIQSVLNQTFTNLEIIVINDGSKDATLDVIDQIKDPRIKVFSYPNAGVATSRNRGLELGKGKYMSFLDADDIWTPDKLESQLNALIGNPNAAVAYSWIDFIDESGNFLRPGSYITINGYALPKLLVTFFPANGSNGLFLTEYLRELGGFDKSVEPAEDWDMYLRLAVKYDFVCVPKPQILYRVSTSSLSTNINKMVNSSLKVINKSFEQAPPDLQHLKNQSIANIYIYLTFKSLESKLDRQNSLLALNLLAKTLKRQPSIAWNRRKLTLIAIVKSILGIVLPSQQAQFLWKNLQKLRKNKIN